MDDEDKGEENQEEKEDENAADADNGDNDTNSQASQENNGLTDKESANESEQQDKKETLVPESKKGKEGSWMPMIIVTALSFIIFGLWERIPVLKNSVHAALDPSAGALLNWNLVLGMLLIVLVINLITTIIQKYATDQKTLKELKKEQKILQEEAKKYKDNPEKVAELSKKQLEVVPKTMKLTSRAIMFTGIPFILFFRWFNDYFSAIPEFKFFGILSWFWFYLIATMIFSMILRKMFDVV